MRRAFTILEMLAATALTDVATVAISRPAFLMRVAAVRGDALLAAISARRRRCL